MKITAFLIPILFYYLPGHAQTGPEKPHDNNPPTLPADSSRQKDVGDLIKLLFSPKNNNEKAGKVKKLSISVVPSAGYTLTTGFAADLTGNAAFFTTPSHKENLSVMDGDLSYDTKLQKIFVSRSEVWWKDNDYKLTSDIRWEQFPEDTYGFGTATLPAAADPLLFDYAKIYATFYKKIIPGNSYYIGLGYNLDYHYNIKETSAAIKTPTDFELYGGQSKTTSSGLNINFLFDTRTNTINSLYGVYVNVTYTQNLTLLGSNSTWEQLQLDMRKYIKLSARSNNVLAFWGYVWFTKGNVPYLDQPFTSGDTFNNTGRGYIQGRYTGRNMLYIESEYRYGILTNGLLGGVLFGNAESLTEYKDNTFKHIAPAAGTGIRIKINKNSNTNVAIDYGFGLHGSRGFFVNLGEVF